MNVPLLFDDKARTRSGPQGLSETTYLFLDASSEAESEAIRRRMNLWIGRFPATGVKELIGRMRSKREEHFNAGLFELFLHEVILGLGATASIHPPMSGEKRTTPDFLVTDPGGYKYYLEAISPTGIDNAEQRKSALFDQVIDRLNDIEPEQFFIVVDLNGSPKSHPRLSDIERFVRGVLSKCKSTNSGFFEVSEMGNERAPAIEYSGDGFSMSLRVYRASDGYFDGESRIVAAHNNVAAWSDWGGVIKESVKSKAGKYGELDLPYVVAVNPQSMGSSQRHDLAAFFGAEHLTGSIDGWGGVKVERDQRGAWVHNGKVMNTRVSAVLMVRNFHCWAPQSAVLRLYHHPMPAMQYSGVLCLLPSGKFNHQTRKMEMFDGKSIEAILGVTNP